MAFFLPAPTAKIAPCGGLITASKLSMPNMPKLEIAKLPPWYSCGASLRSLARVARSFISAESAESDLTSASLRTGVNKPPSMATATATSDGLRLNTRSPAQTAFASGTDCSAKAQALIMKSLIDSLTSRAASCLFNSPRNESSASRLMSRRR